MATNKFRVLIIDDEESMREVIAIILERGGFLCQTAESVEESIRILKEQTFDAVITDLVMNNDSLAGMKILKWIRENIPELPTIMVTAYGSVENAIEAMQAGATDYIQKPFKSNEEVCLRVQKAIEQYHLLRENKALRTERALLQPFEEIIGTSSAIKKIRETIYRVAQLPSTVIIYGESGVGKELIARGIHRLSPRADKPFIAINCASIPETLLESELFGYKRGAFTGAIEDKEGLLVVANGGTVFLDEIGEMPVSLQARLLRVLDNNLVTPVGGTKEIKVDIRIISATNKNLEEMVNKGLFRNDLFFRLNVIPITVPPLRERKEDIPLLINHFLKMHSSRMGLPTPKVTPNVVELFLNYSWPGNIRELSNFIERILALCYETEIDLKLIPDSLKQILVNKSIQQVGINNIEQIKLPPEGIDLEKFIEKIERGLIEQALAYTKYSQKKSAKILGLTPRSFRYRLQKYGLSTDTDETLDKEEDNNISE
ncbi:MAG TPA: sigma-54 dependent transcriptional regulator [Candidatus Hydrogenedens sp.]|nr:sigma-54 dependent transcriptional regulator [Candidatus Hydrogenedens sp.]